MAVDQSTQNDDVYAKYYLTLFEDSLKHITSIVPSNLFICIENTDNFNVGYQKVLEKSLKTNRIFLTRDAIKLIWPKTGERREDRCEFVECNVERVRNLHISGPGHYGLAGYEKMFTDFLKMFQGKDLPLVIETLALKDAVTAIKIICNRGF